LGLLREKDVLTALCEHPQYQRQNRRVAPHTCASLSSLRPPTSCATPFGTGWQRR